MIAGLWDDEVCSEPIGFVCKKFKGGTRPPVTTPKPLPGNCPKTYRPFGNKCFQFNDAKTDDDAMDWKAANDYCMAQNEEKVSNKYKFFLSSISNDQEQGRPT